MNRIVSKERFSEHVYRLVVEAPLIARSRKAGHFVIVRVCPGGERMPLAISEADPVAGTISLVVQEVGVSSTKLCALEPGDCIVLHHCDVLRLPDVDLKFEIPEGDETDF